MEAELRAFEPEMISAAADALTRSRTDLDFTLLDPESFQHATKKSIDYAVMERTTKAAVVPRRHRLVRRRQLGGGLAAVGP